MAELPPGRDPAEALRDDGDLLPLPPAPPAASMIRHPPTEDDWRRAQKVDEQTRR